MRPLTHHGRVRKHWVGATGGPGRVFPVPRGVGSRLEASFEARCFCFFCYCIKLCEL